MKKRRVDITKEISDLRVRVDALRILYDDLKSLFDTVYKMTLIQKDMVVSTNKQMDIVSSIALFAFLIAFVSLLITSYTLWRVLG